MKRTILNKELWYSFLAIIKYILKAIITPQVDGLVSYTPQKQAESRTRIQSIIPIQNGPRNDECSTDAAPSFLIAGWGIRRSIF
jgi:hypothetical protein